MAAVKKVLKKKVVAKRKTTVGLNLSLPKSKSVPETKLENYTTLIFGKKKIGKTTLSSHFQNTIHFMFETGSKALSIYAVIIPTWEHFLGYISLLEKERHSFKTAVIDTGAIAYDRCLEFVCKREGVNHPSDKKDYGKTWKMVSTEFEKAHTRLTALGMGLIVIAHEKIEEVETRSGDTFDQVVPALGKQADEYYAGTMDNIFYYSYTRVRRFLIIRGDEYIVAGTRCERNFLTPRGEQLYSIPMGNSSKTAYTNLVQAFNNKQTITYKPKPRGEEKVTRVKARLKIKK